MTNFNLVPNRRNPNNLNKWTIYPKDVLPMWVADMDFPAPKPILNALHKAVDHGALGSTGRAEVESKQLPKLSKRA